MTPIHHVTLTLASNVTLLKVCDLKEGQEEEEEEETKRKRKWKMKELVMRSRDIRGWETNEVRIIADDIG